MMKDRWHYAFHEFRLSLVFAGGSRALLGATAEVPLAHVVVGKLVVLHVLEPGFYRPDRRYDSVQLLLGTLAMECRTA